MSLHTRLDVIEARHREREAADAPRYLQRFDRDEGGNVTACERLVFQRNPPGLDTLGPMAAAVSAMVREPFTRSTCHYSECEYRDSCRADGALTKWGASKNPASAGIAG